MTGLAGCVRNATEGRSRQAFTGTPPKAAYPFIHLVQDGRSRGG